MSKDSINIKSNGLRNELKEIRKAIDRLTNAILMAQTHTHETTTYNNSRFDADDFMRYSSNKYPQKNRTV